MMDKQGQPAAWNGEARISCKFSFKCLKTWAQLSPTDTASIRHCSACDRDVHLALTEEDFRGYADAGHCVAVRVLQPERSGEDGRGACIVGTVNAPYNPYPKPL